MISHEMTRDDLEEAGFLVEGIAETLRAFSTSEVERLSLGMALHILADSADKALAVIKGCVDQKTLAP
jgi:hypothetical protein